MTARARLAILAMPALVACGPQHVDADARPDPSVVVQRLFDPGGTYAAMGLFAKGAPVPFVASVRFLRGAAADTALAVFGVSLANDALSFRRSGALFEAKYRAEVAFRRGGEVVGRSGSDETVRVGSFPETLRADESVIFQQFLWVPAGTYQVAVSVRDEYGGAFTRAERTVEVPDFGKRRLSDLIPVYAASSRDAMGTMPRFLVNPRGTAPYGLDTLRLYLEAYGLEPGAAIVVRGETPSGETVWSERRYPEGTGTNLRSLVVGIVPERLPVGELRIVAYPEGASDSVSTRALVSFSDRWAITNFDDVLALLRYFGEDEAVDSMRAAAPAERPRRWRAFWERTDPNPITPENEALEGYFRRVQEANTRFQEAGDPGWLTDRGEVYITLGEPDEVFDQSADLQGRRRVIRWTYVHERVALDFVDETGFGRFRLTPISRSEFQHARARARER